MTKWNLGYYSKSKGVEVFYRQYDPRARVQFRANVYVLDRVIGSYADWQNHCGFPSQGYGISGYAVRELAGGKYEITWSCSNSCD